jgi:hypothetical protein
MERFEEEKT